MSSPSNNMMEMNSPPKAPGERQRANDEDSGQSIGFFLAFVYFLKGFMASGIYVFPVSVNRVGGNLTLVIPLLAINYVLIALCLYILVANNTGSKTYPEFVKTTFDNGTGYFPKVSKVFKIFVIIFGFTFSFCVCSIYLSFITSHVCQVTIAIFSSNHNIDFHLVTVIVAIILIVPHCTPILSSLALSILALIGLIFQLLAICLGFVYFFDDSDSYPMRLELPTIDDLFLAESYIIYASEGINLFFPLIAAMKKPDQLLGCPSLLCAGIITLAAFGLIVCGAGASKMYSTAHFIFLMTPTTTLGIVVKIFAAIGIFFTYPLQLDVAYHYIVDELDIDNKGPVKYVTRAFLVLLTVGLAMMNPPHFHYFMGVLGALCLTVLTFIVPGLIPICTENYGRKKWMAIVALDAFMLGIATLIDGTTTNAIDWSRANYSNYETYC